MAYGIRIVRVRILVLASFPGPAHLAVRVRVQGRMRGRRSVRIDVLIKAYGNPRPEHYMDAKFGSQAHTSQRLPSYKALVLKKLRSELRLMVAENACKNAPGFKPRVQTCNAPGAKGPVGTAGSSRSNQSKVFTE